MKKLILSALVIGLATTTMNAQFSWGGSAEKTTVLYNGQLINVSEGEADYYLSRGGEEVSTGASGSTSSATTLTDGTNTIGAGGSASAYADAGVTNTDDEITISAAAGFCLTGYGFVNDSYLGGAAGADASSEITISKDGSAPTATSSLTGSALISTDADEVEDCHCGTKDEEPTTPTTPSGQGI